MKATKKQEDFIAVATKYAMSGADAIRYMTLRRFSVSHKKVVSIGSAGYEPVIIKATHAIDISPIAGDFLKQARWNGQYFTGSVTELPFKDKEFDCGVCSEVIEHLVTMAEVDKAFFEIDRTCKNWIITTPAVPVPEPDHKRVFTAEQIQAYAAMYSANSIRIGIWWFVWRSHKTFNPLTAGVVPQSSQKYFCMPSHNIPRGMSHA